MPIRPELRHFYGKEWRTVTRPRILARAQDKCEDCQVPNHTIVARHRDYPGWWFDVSTGAAHDRAGKWRKQIANVLEMPGVWLVNIVLTVSHNNHVSGDDADENLKARCQSCHLNYDREHHRETRAIRKDGARPLLAQAEARA